MKNKYDLIVVGGGFAGVAAAVEAAEKGLQVLLVEKYNCLGGAAANCLVMPFMPYSTTDPETGENRILTGNFFTRVGIYQHRTPRKRTVINADHVSFLSHQPFPFAYLAPKAAQAR